MHYSQNQRAQQCVLPEPTDEQSLKHTVVGRHKR